MKVSLKNKILVAFFGLISLGFIAQQVFNIFFAKEFYSNYKASVVEHTFYDIRTTYNGEIESIYDIALNAEDAHNMRISIIENEEMSYTTRSDMAFRGFEGVSKEKPIEYEVTFSPKPKARIKSEADEVSNMRLSGVFTHDDDEIYVSIGLPVMSIENSVAILTRSNTTISFAILIFSIAFSFFVSKGITKPIADIEEVSKKLSQLDFSCSANENVSTKEIGSLAKHINSMSIQLKNAITDLKIANTSLQNDIDYQKQSEKMRREFVANVSHEMKTPLSILQIYSENLKNNIDGIDKAFYCDTIIEETNYLSEMVKSMLDISAIENSIYKMDLKTIDFSKLCDEIINKTAPMASDYAFEVVVEQGIKILGDSHYLEQAMKNYITNGIFHTVKGGRIEINLCEKDGFAEFSVFNQGNHMDKEIMRHCWESFVKSDKARTRTAEGNVGLGLYIVKTIIEKHGGKYDVKNVQTVVLFSLSIPIEKEILSSKSNDL